MKILYGEEPDHVVKSRQTFLLDLYLNLPGKEYTFACLWIDRILRNKHPLPNKHPFLFHDWWL